MNARHVKRMERALRVRTRAGIAAAAAAALACTAVGPDYETPEVVLPSAWNEPASATLAERQAELAGWWRSFEDPLLDDLVERSARQGLDLREALLRVREARALRGVAAADYWPTIDGTASFERRGESENTQFGQFVTDTDVYSAGFDASWELDLWGRVRRSVEAADADLAATVEDARDVAVTLAAETAANYVLLRAFQTRVEIARTNVALQEETLALVRGRFEAGLVGENDVVQALTTLETTRSALPAFEIGVRAAENRLSVLLGLAPGALSAELAGPQPIPVPPLEVAVGVPADLVRRRADVRRAERELAAEIARIGVAEGDLYPRLALFGSLGLTSEDAADLFEHDSGFFSFGPSIRWNLFDGGRLRRIVDAQDARADQALVRWEREVLTALEEAENAMTAFVYEQARRDSLVEAATQARRAVELARIQYGEGLSDFQTVLDSQRSLALLEDGVAQSEAAIATDLISLYKALGGGWDEPPVVSAAP